ncbi:hypothetical protein EDC40_10356 [Aminobacter aminovorans]|uniref:Uncharacterized protein n=2 Tax=Aminobacter aminovorans TaxID=83263 RepID=A0A380WNW3_AMIAI|nr:hypothetical protein EDC40_10356 [Aminobacter aminovorans]SUU89996.1 Uncharacterised protein [Aminobacter aminovorans]
MTPAEIAEHALKLADAVEYLQSSVDTLRENNNKAARALEGTQDALAAHLGVVCRIRELFEAHRKREARDLLRGAASTIFEREPAPVLEPLQWSNTIFSPFPERQGG